MIVLGSSSGSLVRYHINNAQVFPQDNVQVMKFDGGISALSMDP